jgi:hypothetical protein
MRNDIEVYREEQTYTTNETDNYLTMARIMEKQLKEWTRENIYGKSYTGYNEIMAKKAYIDGFTAGFCFKFTGEG